MEEEEAMRSYCREMIFRVRNKQQHLQPPREEERRGHKHRGRQGGRERTETRRKVVAEDEWRNYRERNVPLPDCTERERQQPSLNLRCQGPDVQPVPPQVISMLRLKTFKEEMRRATEVALHDPAVCSMCEQEQASLALKSFIWRKKTQLQFQTLKGRLNTHMDQGDCTSLGSWCKMSQSPPMPLAGFGRNYLVKICGSQQPGVALATTKERGVALATDEMRGYPDKSATGTHLARPHCPFPDR
ncbi:uncharacterized protein LOC108882768 [Lates calcarifer]|uniref:Uncharacterized protein LOC108882768 n=1 Tax=Lates calcarifer TaxID=8187 RepID=A0AAJ7LUJ2_LATCA|nr:uncharacterized protein LOC108882768 [Lates calcarifer]